MQSGTSYSAQDHALAFQRGEEKAFDWFFREWYLSLSFYAFKITGDQPVAEDIVSAAFIKIWQRHTQFSAPETIRAYLYRIVYNDCLQWHRKQKKDKGFQENFAYLEKEKVEEDHSEHMVRAETLHHLFHAFKKLPPACNKVLNLLYTQGKTVTETARILNISANTVKSQRKKGLAILRHTLPLIVFFVSMIAGPFSMGS